MLRGLARSGGLQAGACPAGVRTDRVDAKQLMEFRHKNIRLSLDRYVGCEWYFVTFCCENRQPLFRQSAYVELFLNHVRSEAATHEIAVHAYCLMPDHVHLLAQGLKPSSDLLRFLKLLKQKTGFEYKQKTGKQLWQKKSYDRVLRSGESPESVAWYIWMNPVRRGLCRKAEEYDFSGSFTEAKARLNPPMQLWTPPWKDKAPT